MSVFEVHMKPTGNNDKRKPQYIVEVGGAKDKNDAARIAREQAQCEGFGGYAITKIREVKNGLG